MEPRRHHSTRRPDPRAHDTSSHTSALSLYIPAVQASPWSHTPVFPTEDSEQRCCTPCQIQYPPLYPSSAQLLSPHHRHAHRVLLLLRSFCCAPDRGLLPLTALHSVRFLRYLIPRNGSGQSFPYVHGENLLQHP